ncbi:MAG: tetratricopeptide repeat protein [Bryobacteraceae bacterium]
MASPDLAREHFTRGVELLKAGQDQRASEELKRAAELRPDLIQAKVLYGLALFRSGRASAGEQQARAALEKEPGNPQALHLLGLCLLRQDRLDEGIGTLEAALEAQPGNIDAAATLATVYVGRGEVDKAEALLEGPLAKVERAETFLVRGVVAKARNNWVSAAETLGHAVRLNPKLPVAHSELAHTFLLMGDSERAEAEFRNELELQPGDFHASIYLAWHYMKERRYRDALPLLEAAGLRKPDNAGVLYLQGQAHQVLGDNAKAAVLLERAITKEPDFMPAHVLLARAYAKLGRMEDARREKTVITRLREEEQRRNLGTGQSYAENSAVPQLEVR